MNELEVKRAARREANLRTVNERITAAIGSMDPDVTDFTIVCECSLDDCDSTFAVPVSTYNEVRSHGARFLTLPTHVYDLIERVAQHGGRGVFLEKHGVAADTVKGDA